MKSIQFRFYLLWQQPTRMIGTVLFFLLFALLGDWVDALWLSALLAIAVCCSCPDFPAIRKLYSLYCRLCLGPSNNYLILKTACDDADSDSFCRKFETVWTDARLTFSASLIGALELLAVLSIPLVIPRLLGPVHWSYFREHAELELLDIGALAGTALLVVVTHFKLPEQPFRNIRNLGFILTLLLLCIAMSGAIIFFPEPMIMAKAHVSPMGLHALGVLLASFLLFVYDMVALRGVHRLTHFQDESEAELLETCFIIDLPVVISLAFVVVYWFVKHEELKETCNALLTGALVLQFIISAIQFVLIKERIVSKMAHKSIAIEQRSRGQSA